MRIDNLTQEQVEVLFDYVAYAKREHKSYVPLIMKAARYDHIYGEYESLELLNDCFYELIRIEKLNREEIEELASLLSEREVDEENDPNDIFHPEAGLSNETRKRNRAKKKTNGLEYL